MIIKNPTDNTLEVVIKGDKYTVEPQGEISVSEGVATYWKQNIHQFIILQEQVVKAIPEVKKEEVVDEEVAPKNKKK